MKDLTFSCHVIEHSLVPRARDGIESCGTYHVIVIVTEHTSQAQINFLTTSESKGLLYRKPQKLFNVLSLPKEKRGLLKHVNGCTLL